MPVGGADLVEMELVRLLLEETPTSPPGQGRVSPADFGHPALRSIVEVIFARAEEGKKTTAQDIAAEQVAAERRPVGPSHPGR